MDITSIPFNTYTLRFMPIFIKIKTGIKNVTFNSIH